MQNRQTLKLSLDTKALMSTLSALAIEIGEGGFESINSGVNLADVLVETSLVQSDVRGTVDALELCVRLDPSDGLRRSLATASTGKLNLPVI